MSTDIREFASQWLREGMDATQIDGFGPGTAPPPPLEFEDLDTGKIIRPEPEPEPPPSPLVALAQSAPRVTRMIDPPIVPAVGQSLSVLGDAGFYKGTHADLSKHDQAAIGRIILESAHRKLREQLAEVSKAAPRRVRKNLQPIMSAQMKDGAEIIAKGWESAAAMLKEPSMPPETPKKRRGRPPKVSA